MDNYMMFLLGIVVWANVLGVAMITFIYIATVKWIQYLKAKISIDDKNKKRIYDNELIHHTKEMMEFIKFISTENTVIKFREFQDNTVVDKINRSSVEKLIMDIANHTFSSLNESNFSMDDTILSREFYMKYIIDVTTMNVKRLMDNTLDQTIII